MEYNTSVKEASTKVIAAKTPKFYNSYYLTSRSKRTV